MKIRVALLVVLGMFVVIIGMNCSGPPTDELMQAEAALRAAQAEGAEDYAPEYFKAAAEALADAKSKTESRDYDAARESAIDAKQKADAAKVNVGPEKRKMRGEIETSMSALTEEWDGLMKARVSRKTREAIDTARASFAQLVADVKDKMESEDYIGAMQSMKDARMKAAEVKAMVEEK